MKLHIFKLTDIVRYSKSIIDKGFRVTPGELQNEANQEGYDMPLRMARRYAWSMRNSALIQSHFNLTL